MTSDMFWILAHVKHHCNCVSNVPMWHQRCNNQTSQENLKNAKSLIPSQVFQYKHMKCVSEWSINMPHTCMTLWSVSKNLTPCHRSKHVLMSMLMFMEKLQSFFDSTGIYQSSLAHGLDNLHPNFRVCMALCKYTMPGSTHRVLCVAIVIRLLNLPVKFVTCHVSLNSFAYRGLLFHMIHLFSHLILFTHDLVFFTCD